MAALPAARAPAGDPAASPEEVASVSVELRTSRGPPPLLALPPLLTADFESCGGGSSPAPFAPSTVRVGGMLGAGDPGAAARRQRVQHRS